MKDCDREKPDLYEDVYLSVVIPTYNEWPEIYKTIRKIKNYLDQQKYNAEILVVDDASTDNTCQRLANSEHSLGIRVFRNHANSGKGYSVRKGVLASRGQFILIIDADSAYDITTLKEVLTPLLHDKCDIVLGNRRMIQSKFVLSPKYLPYIYYRHLIGQFFNLICRVFVLQKFRDTQCGYKCFRREAALKIFKYQRINGYCFDVEVLFLAVKLGYRLLQIPVTFYYHGEPSSIRLFPDAFISIRDLFRIRINEMLGVYDSDRKV